MDGKIKLTTQLIAFVLFVAFGAPGKAGQI